MRAFRIIALLFPLAACTVGPEYAGPPATAPVAARASGFTRAGDLATAAALPAARWWQTLGDPVLDTLEDRALAANPDVAIAEARLRQARSALRLDRANNLPKVDAQATYLHARLPGGLGTLNGDDAEGGSDKTGSLNFYNLGFDASWEVDLFGGARRTNEAARATFQAAEATLADAQVSLSAEIAHAYVDLRDRQARIQLSRESSEMQQRMLALTQQRFERGTASALDVERLRGQVLATNAQLLPLGGEVETYLNALATLTGAEPGALDGMLAPQRALPLPPAAVALGDPAALLRRRPDIRAAERRLAAETARIGVAEAARFPRLTFLGIIGIGGTKPSDLSSLDDVTALAAPMLQWSFLDFGRARARVGQAEAVRDEALARYSGTVLGALRDAEDALSRFRARRFTVASLARQKESAYRAAGLMQQRYRAGTATLIDTLDTERQRVAAEQNLSVASANLTGDYIALQKALGLGWTPAAAD